MVVLNKYRLNSETTFKDLIINDKNKSLIDYLTDYCNNIEKKINECENCIITGTCGSGKSYILNAFKNEVKKTIIEAEENNIYYSSYQGENRIIKRKVDCCIIKIYDLIKELREVEYGKKEMIINYKKYDVLIIDEVGVQFDTEAERQILYDFIDFRYNTYRPTFLISNLELETTEKQKGFDRILGQRIISRINLNNCKFFKLTGNFR